jgi:plastocyanin
VRTPALIGIVLVATLAVGGCADKAASSSARPDSTSAKAAASTPAVGAKIDLGGQTTTYHGTADVTGTGKVTIQMQNRYFSPTVIHGKPGQKLVLDLVNQSPDAHTFTTADGLADISVQPRSVAEGKITLPGSGNLLFFSRIDKAQGMVGAFNVSGPLNSPVPTASPQVS